MDSNGNDLYLPGYEQGDRLRDQHFRRKMDFLNVPIMFFNGKYKLLDLKSNFLLELLVGR